MQNYQAFGSVSGRSRGGRRRAPRRVRLALTAALLCLLALALSGCYLVQKSPDYYGTQTAGKNVVFVMDASGSMEGKNEGSLQSQVRGRATQMAGNTVANKIGGTLGNFLGGELTSEATKLGGAKRELIPAVRGLDQNSRFAIVVFGDNVRTWQTRMVAANAINKNLATAYIKHLSAGGGTPALAALEKAFQFNNAQAFFVATDGQPTDADSSQILQRVRQMNTGRGILIHTIGLGKDQDASFLSALARQNNGKYTRR